MTPFYRLMIGGVCLLAAALLTLAIGCAEPSLVEPTTSAPEVLLLRPDKTCQVDAAAQCTNCDGSEPGCSYTYTCSDGSGGCVNVQQILCRLCLKPAEQ